jgi:hypothetical protein
LNELLARILPAQKNQVSIAVGVCLAAGLIALIWDLRSSNKAHALESKPQTESVEEAATFIPDGFVLVPIEVANYESLDSILGPFGVVDLFVSSDNPKVRPRKVAERVKILRAPLNPSHFAVLVPDSESQKIVAYSGALTVVVQNPKKSGPTLVNPDIVPAKAKQRVSRVIVEVPNVVE